MEAPVSPGLVVLDRDGVINVESPDFIRTYEEWRPLPGSLDAIARLANAGMSVVVATNQSGIGRGLLTTADLVRIHAEMTAAIGAAGGRLSGIFYCPHTPEDRCECRKPKPGLLRQIEQQFGARLEGRPVIGDSMRDLEAAKAVGGRPILVRTGNGRATEQQHQAELEGVEVFDDLAHAVDALVGSR